MRVALLLLLLVGWTAATEVICYWGAWTTYRKGDGKITVDDLDPSKCSIYIYSFAKLDPKTYTMVMFDSWLDGDLKGYEKFVGMKRRNPSLKVLLAIGGWNDSRGSKYSTMMASASKRANFIRQAIVFLQKYGFDGLDLDYEYPSASDKPNFAKWAQELSAAFKPKGLLLTAAVSPARAKISAGYDVPSLARSLDMINVMAYDLHGSWEAGTADHHAALKPRSTDHGNGLDVQSSMQSWMSAGAPAAKLAMGVPIYGRSWRVPGGNKNPPASASGAGTAGEYSREAGSLTYLEICKRVNSGWTVVQDSTGKMGPYAYKGDQWVGYDDVAMTVTKTQWALSQGFGGVMVWDVGSSDARNICGGGAWPIISAMTDTVGGSPPRPTSGTTAWTTAGTTAATTALPGGEFSCPSDGLFADPADCKSYYNCFRGAANHYTCSGATLYDVTCSCCNWAGAVSCSSDASDPTN